MGYLIKYGDDVLFQPGDDDAPIHDARLGMRTDAVSTLDFTVPPGHPLRGQLSIRDFANPVRVWFDTQLLFCGFVSRITETLYKELEVACVSDLQLLADVHIRLPDHPNVNPKRMAYHANEVFSIALQLYNGLVGDQHKFVVGANIAADAVGYYDAVLDDTVVKVGSMSPTSALDVIASSILQPYGCMLKVWYSNGIRYIGLFTEPNVTNTQIVQFGENMTSYDFSTSDEELYTGCYPVGGTKRDYVTTGGTPMVVVNAVAATSRTMTLRTVSGSVTMGLNDVFVVGDGMELESAGVYTIDTSGTQVTVNASQGAIPAGTPAVYLGRSPQYTSSSTLTLNRLDDGDYDSHYYKDGGVVYDTVAAAMYGLRTFTFTDTSLTYAPALLKEAEEMIREQIYFKRTLDVDAVDMALYMSGYTHLLAGQKVRVVSVPHQIDDLMQVTSADLDLDNPGATKYVLGAVPGSVTRKMAGMAQETSDVKDQLTYELSNVVPQSYIWGLS